MTPVNPAVQPIQEPFTRHIPVCIISTDDSRSRALAFVAKPIQSRDVLDRLLTTLTDYREREIKRLLVIEPDAAARDRLVKAIGKEDMEVLTADDDKAALKLARKHPVDCAVVNPSLVGIAAKLARGDESEPVLVRLPVIVYGDGEPGESMKQLGDLCAVQRAYSPERLLDMVMLALPEAGRQKLMRLHQSDKLLAGKKVLIVDDDMRNIFALSSVLEEHQMNIISADNGRDAIHILQQEQDIDIVLMNIMMPEMDGMETMREIRKAPRLKNLPIVAVTAKAMKGDREKCIEAGAWDYLSKPVDTEQMFAVLRAWLHR